MKPTTTEAGGSRPPAPTSHNDTTHASRPPDIVSVYDGLAPRERVRRVLVDQAAEEPRCVATQLALAGVNVFPCRPIGDPAGGKTPLTRHGYLDATTDLDTVTKWWRTWPDALVGIVPGSAGLVVFDGDVKHDPSGLEQVEDLFHGYGASATDSLTVSTPSGGRHYYCWMVGDSPIGNVDGAKLVGTRGVLDIRSAAGYVIAPSLGSGYSIAHDEPIQPLPAGLSELLLEVGKVGEVRASPGGRSDANELVRSAVNAAYNVVDILCRHGWVIVSVGDPKVTYLRHPGATNHKSATVYADGMACIWTTSTVFREREQVGAFSAIAQLDFKGDWPAAWKWAREQFPGEAAEDDRAWTVDQQSVDGSFRDVSGARPASSPVRASTTAPQTGTEIAAWAAEPGSLSSDEDARAEFPTEHLPMWFLEYCGQVAFDLQLAFNFVCAVAFGYAGVATTGGFDLRLNDSLTVPVHLWTWIVRASGGGKTMLEKKFAKGLYQAQTSAVEKWRELHLIADEAARAAEARYRAAAKQHERAGTVGPNGLLPDDGVTLDKLVELRREAERLRALVPLDPGLLHGDVTPEYLSARMGTDLRPRYAIVTAEPQTLLSRVTTRAGATNIDPLLAGYDGGPLSVGRKGGGTVGQQVTALPRVWGSMVVMMQPRAAQSILDDQTLAAAGGRGFGARPCWLDGPSNLGDRDWTDHGADRTRHSTVVEDEFHARIGAIAERAMLADAPELLSVGQDGRREFGEWCNSIERRLGAGGDLASHAEVAEKTKFNVLRAAGILHLLRNEGTAADVSVATIRAAIEFGEYWIATYIALRNSDLAPPALVLARRLKEIAERLATGRSERRRVTVRRTANGEVVFTHNELNDALRSSKHRLTADEFAQVIEELRIRGWVQVISGATPPDTVPPITTKRGDRTFLVWHPALVEVGQSPAAEVADTADSGHFSMGSDDALKARFSTESLSPSTNVHGRPLTDPTPPTDPSYQVPAVGAIAKTEGDVAPTTHGGETVRVIPVVRHADAVPPIPEVPGASVDVARQSIASTSAELRAFLDRVFNSVASTGQAVGVDALAHSLGLLTDGHTVERALRYLAKQGRLSESPVGSGLWIVMDEAAA